MVLRSTFCLLTLAAALAPTVARADARGVGLGVAGGVDMYRAEQEGVSSEFKGSLSWGFFVDIPLLQTFYITPQTTLYDLDFGGGKVAVTDVDINFKFIVPLGNARLGGGVTAGLTTGLGEDYYGHYGGVGFFAITLVSNIEGFAMVQYKRIPYRGANIQDMHGFVGAMFFF